MRLRRTSPKVPVVLVRGERCMVWDTSGKAYVDLLSGVWCGVLGHGHPRLAKAIGEQVSQIAHVGAAFGSTAIDLGLSKLEEVLPPQLSGQAAGRRSRHTSWRKVSSWISTCRPRASGCSRLSSSQPARWTRFCGRSGGRCAAWEWPPGDELMDHGGMRNGRLGCGEKDR